MKVFYSLFAALLLTIVASAQTVPQKMTYQAVVRNSSGNLVTNQQVRMRISILKKSPSGKTVYLESQKSQTNKNGLITLQVGGGNVISGNFSSINWADGPFFLKTETDPSGGTNYSIESTSQFLSVPYAYHAKTSDSLKGGINENDPVFDSSVAKGISKADTAYWNNKLDSFIESDPKFSNSVASKIDKKDTNRWNNKQDSLVAGKGLNIENDTIHFKDPNPFHLGQDTLGGIVFYLYKGEDGKQHGLIVSKSEKTNVQWQSTTSKTNANRSWDGDYNMNQMSNSPLKNWILSNFNNNWYLPSIDELSILWNNRFHVNKALKASSNTLISRTASYWSSTEENSSSAFPFLFGQGKAGGATLKTNNYRARAIREF